MLGDSSPAPLINPHRDALYLMFRFAYFMGQAIYQENLSVPMSKLAPGGMSE